MNRYRLKMRFPSGAQQKAPKKYEKDAAAEGIPAYRFIGDAPDRLFDQ